MSLRDGRVVAVEAARAPDRAASPCTRVERGLVDELTGTEVHQDDSAAVARAHHVLRLHVAVDEVRPMDRGKSQTDLLADVVASPGLSSPRRGAAERLAVDEDPSRSRRARRVCPRHGQ